MLHLLAFSNCEFKYDLFNYRGMRLFPISTASTMNATLPLSSELCAAHCTTVAQTVGFMDLRSLMLVCIL